MANQGIFSGGVKIRSLNGYLIAVNGEVFATTNTGGTTNAFFYRAKTTITSGDPGNGHLIWNNATQISATQLNISHLTDTPVEDIDLFLSAITSGNKLVVQDRNNSQNYQSWTVSSAPTQVGSTYWTIPVSLIESQGTGTTGFANNHDLLFAIITGGTGGGGITTNAVTFNNSGSGAASGTSFNGATPVTVSYNTIGAQQASAKLSSLASLTYVSGTPFVKMTGANTFALDTNTYLTGNQTITVSGDASGSGATTIALTLATVNSNIGTFNNVTVNAKGLVTAASNVAYLTANQTITLSGNVTGSGTTSITTTIGNNVVTNAMLAQIATARIRGRVTAGTGNVEDLTGTQATTLLDTFTSALKGLAPASGGGTTNFLRADGTWAAPSGGGGTPGGSNRQIQYNNSGAFGADANFSWSTGSNLLVGTSTDNGVDKLQVSGSAIATRLKVNTSGQTLEINNYYSGGNGRNIWIGGGGSSSNSSAWGNVSLGDNAMLSTTSAFFNTAIGASALQLITSGDRNMAIGFEALYSTTSGTRNVGVGVNALGTNSTGSNNMAIGTAALLLSTTAGDNVAVGSDALRLITTGSNNIAFGTDAGRRISAGGDNQTSNQSIYIGQDTRSSANGNTNEMVFGHNAIGQGSNTVTLGNSSITKTFLRGTVLVNTTTDNGVDKLQINGSVISTSGYKITSGTSSQYLKADGTTQQITSGTAAPTGGNDNDIYFQYDVSILTGSGSSNQIAYFSSASAINGSNDFQWDNTNKIFTLNGLFRGTVTTNRQTASYTLVLSDNGKLIEMNVSTANNLTIPLNSSVAFPVGTQIDAIQYGTGQTTIVAASGVTIRSQSGYLKIGVRYSAVTLIKISTDEWYCIGNLVA